MMETLALALILLAAAAVVGGRIYRTLRKAYEPPVAPGECPCAGWAGVCPREPGGEADAGPLS